MADSTGEKAFRIIITKVSGIMPNAMTIPKASAGNFTARLFHIQSIRAINTMVSEREKVNITYCF